MERYVLGTPAVCWDSDGYVVSSRVGIENCTPCRSSLVRIGAQLDRVPELGMNVSIDSLVTDNNV